MAPKRKPTNPSETDAVAVADTVVRRSTRLSNAAAAVAKPAAVTDPAPPKKKKAKTKTKTKTATETNSSAEEEVEAKAPLSPAVEEPVSEPETIDASKTVVIEHCKQCNSFKTRAIQVKKGLEEEVAGVNVVVNPEKPRKGCFEIREEGGDIFVSLLDMKRPFPPLKALDMDKLISDIVEKLR